MVMPPLEDHGEVISDGNGNGNRVQCNYCRKVLSRVSHLREHLAGKNGKNSACPEAPRSVWKVFQNYKQPPSPAPTTTTTIPLHGSSIEDHGEVVTDGSVRCNYCKKVLVHFSNLKRHLAGTNGKTSSCPDAPHSVWKMFQNYKQPPTTTLHESKRRRTYSSFSLVYEDSPTTTATIVGDSNDAAESHLLEPESINVHGGQHKPYKGYFEEVEFVGCAVRKIKESWPCTGCSILVDGWTDPIEGRDLVCFIVDCPKGPIYFRSSYLHVSSSRNNGDVDDALNMLNQVVESVGEDNVVQVVATSTFGWIGSLREQFVEKHTKVFWTTSASHNIHLMLEKIGRLHRVKAVLDKVNALLESHEHLKSSSNNMKSVMSALETLENVVQAKHQLETQVEDVSFWTEAKMVLKAMLPLCRLLALIHDDKLQTGYIYDALDRAKEEIKKELKDFEDNYMPFWKVIDDVWNKYLHIPLHAAGYYLNPGFFYSDYFEGNKEVNIVFFRCMVCMIQDHRTLDQVSLQLEKYRVASGAFGEGSSGSHRDIPPLEWWNKYGGECPELQKFAIRVLSQTCDGASRYGLRRHIAERMSTKGMKNTKQSLELHEDFVHYNLLLHENMNSNQELVISDNGHSSSREELDLTVRGGWMESC